MATATEPEPEGEARDAAFTKFLSEVKQIEKKDAVLTGKQQIDRLLKPGASYMNLNPFEVLMIAPDTTPELIRKAYRKLSFLVHPDKNQEDKERAQTAFEAVNKAYKMLEEEEQLTYCREVVDEARALTEQKVKERKKYAKKQLGTDHVEEDDPEKYEQLFRKTMTKLFADLEIKKRHMEERDQLERKRQREKEDEEESKAKQVKEWKKEWESTRTDRVDSWRSFQDKSGKKKKVKAYTGLKPPKLKQEKR